MQATGCFTVLANLRIRHVRIVITLKPFVRSPSPSFKIGGHERGVAVDAHGRRVKLLALGEGLVLEHVGVAAAFAVIAAKSSRPTWSSAGVLLQFRTRHHRAWIGLGRRMRHRFAAAVLGALHVHGPLVEVVLQREVLAPDCRIVDGVVEFDHAIERILGFLLAFEDVDRAAR